MRSALASLLLLFAACATRPTSAGEFAAALPSVTCSAAELPSIDGPSGASLQIIAVGDAGEPGPQLTRTIEAMKKVDGLDALLLAGDNVYRCGLRDASDSNWQRVIAPLFVLGKPIYPVLGNHDWGRRAIPGCAFSTPGAEIARNGLWQFPAPAYTVMTDVAEFIMIDSSPIAYGWPDRMPEALCAVRGALARPKTRPWRIVVGHHPLFSCGEHGAEDATQNMRTALQQLFAEAKVDLYVAGHDHDLELPSAPAPPAYVVSGAGSKIRKRGAQCPEGETFRIVGGFALLDISASDLDIRVYCNGSEAPCMERRVGASLSPEHQP
ncbi:MAG TPA: metallophosphoesterase [Thermoanaerobaculia bacterium]|nr:metallophosphoesterase [Thermoanaerobaculia bacterium]